MDTTGPMIEWLDEQRAKADDEITQQMLWEMRALIVTESQRRAAEQREIAEMRKKAA